MTVSNTHLSLEDKLGTMNREQLVELADKQYGVKIDTSVDVKSIRRTLVDMDNNAHEKALTENEKSTKMIVECAKRKGINDPIIPVKFLNMEFKNADVSFNYDSGLGIKGPKNKDGLDSSPSFHLYPNQIYRLPLSVIKHLESLTTLDNQVTTDPETGQITSNTPVVVQRYQLVPQLTEKDYQNIGK